MIFSKGSPLLDRKPGSSTAGVVHPLLPRVPQTALDQFYPKIRVMGSWKWGLAGTRGVKKHG